MYSMKYAFKFGNILRIWYITKHLIRYKWLAVGWMNRVRFSTMGDFSLLHYIVMGSVTHPASYSVFNGGLFPGLTLQGLSHSLSYFMPQTEKENPNVGRRDTMVITCTTYFNIPMSAFCPRFHLCVLYYCHDKQRLFPWIEQIDWSL